MADCRHGFSATIRCTKVGEDLEEPPAAWWSEDWGAGQARDIRDKRPEKT